MMKNLLVVINLIFLLATTISGQDKNAFVKKCPTLEPEVFLPNIISDTTEYEFGSALSKDYNEIYIGIRLNDDWKAEIRYSELKNGEWSSPQRFDFEPEYTYNDPFLNEKEDKLYFVSNRPLNGSGKPKDFDIWYIQKTKDGWSKPIHTGTGINSDKDEFYVTISNNGTIYFVSNRHTKGEEDQWDFDIYYSELKDGKYQEPVRLGYNVNSEYFECDPYISPDESYLIFSSSCPGGLGHGDLYICFKNEDGTWTKSVNMGDKINTGFHEFCPQVTRDGKCFFYTSQGDIYWINTEIFNELKNNL